MLSRQKNRAWRRRVLRQNGIITANRRLTIHETLMKQMRELNVKTLILFTAKRAISAALG
jgi:hypothetical protein